jgi:hypothetical protein
VCGGAEQRLVEERLDDLRLHLRICAGLSAS